MGRVVNRKNQLSLLGPTEGKKFPVGDRPPAARKTDPDTSRQAALSVDKLTEKQTAVLITVTAYGPMTDAEMVDRYQRSYARANTPHFIPRQSDSGLRTRRHELTEAGLIEEHGKKKLPTGRNAIVWKAT